VYLIDWIPLLPKLGLFKKSLPVSQPFIGKTLQAYTTKTQSQKKQQYTGYQNKM